MKVEIFSRSSLNMKELSHVHNDRLMLGSIGEPVVNYVRV